MGKNGIGQSEVTRVHAVDAVELRVARIAVRRLPAENYPANPHVRDYR